MGSSWLLIFVQVAVKCELLSSAGTPFDVVAAQSIMGEKATGMNMSNAEGQVIVDFPAREEFTFQGETINLVTQLNETCNMTWTCPNTTAFTATWGQSIDSVFKVSGKPSIRYTGAKNGTLYAVSMHDYGDEWVSTTRLHWMCFNVPMSPNHTGLLHMDAGRCFAIMQMASNYAPMTFDDVVPMSPHMNPEKGLGVKYGYQVYEQTAQWWDRNTTNFNETQLETLGAQIPTYGSDIISILSGDMVGAKHTGGYMLWDMAAFVRENKMLFKSMTWYEVMGNAYSSKVMVDKGFHFRVPSCRSQASNFCQGTWTGPPTTTTTTLSTLAGITQAPAASTAPAELSAASGCFCNLCMVVLLLSVFLLEEILYWVVSE